MQHLYKFLFFRFILSLSLLFFLLPQTGFAQVTISCPTDTLIQPNDPGLCGAIVNYTPPVGTGTGTNITTELASGPASGDFFPVDTTSVTYRVFNDEGDEDFCTFVVIITDTEDPEFDCPDNITVNAAEGDCEAVVTFDIPTATDNCAVVNLFQFGGLPSGSLFPAGQSSVDFRADDAAGNSAFCRIVITVIDVTDPEIICPPDTTIEVTSTCEAVVNYTAPVGVDACSDPFTTLTVQTGGLGSGSTFPLGTTVETYTVTDADGNTASCSFNVNVVDVAAPVLTCPGDIAIAAAPGDCDAIVSFADATATDNCPGTTVVQTQGPPSGNPFPVGTTVVTFTATDGSGNSSSCSFNVSVTEDEDPSIDCPFPITTGTDPGACEAVVNYIPPVGTDNCPGASTLLISGLGSGAAFPVGTTTETYEVTDASGNTASCSFTVTVNDLEAPILDCPAEIEANNTPGQCDAVVNFALPGATDNCPGVTVTQTAGPISGSTFTVGVTTIAFTAEDAAGNEITCDVDVIVADIESPVITCTPSITIEVPPGDCQAEVVYPMPTFTDNCAGGSVNLVSGPSNGTLLDVGVYNVTFEAVDEAGNVDQCTFEVTIQNSNPPVFTCPGNLSVPTDPGACSAVVNFTLPEAVDPCSDVSVTQVGGPASGSTFPIGSTTLTFEAEDEFGNIAICSYDVVVQDAEAPVIDCPATIVQSADPGLCSAVVNFVLPMVSDNCPGASLSQTDGPLSGSTFPVGSTNITFTAIDASGNSSTCTLAVEVIDNEIPTIDCPGDVVVDLAPENCEGIVNYHDPVINDNCPGVSFTVLDGPASGDVVPAGIYTVTLEAIDAANNIAICSFTLTVNETNPPVFDCPVEVLAQTDPGLCSATVDFSIPDATDPCSPVTVTQIAGPSPGSVFPIGTTSVEFLAEDTFGNTSTCAFNIVLEDEEAPVIDCLDTLEIVVATGSCEAEASFALPSVSDNCPGATILQTDGPATGSILPVGTFEVEFTATDATGNITTCILNIVILDEEDPEIICPTDAEIVLDPASCEGTITYGTPTVSDNCPGTTFSLTEGPASGSLVEAGTYQITFEATDASGNTSSCSFEVTLTETDPPVFDCPDDITVNADPGACEAIVEFEDPTATDSCSDVTVSQIAGPSSGSAFPAGPTTITFEATDASGNVSTCSFTVSVLDDIPPVINCPDNIEIENDPAICGAVVTYSLPTASDNCGDISLNITEGFPSGALFPVGSTVVTYEAVDLSGNTAACSFEITVLDVEEPVLTCPTDILVNLADGQCDTTLTFAVPTVVDNCSVQSITQTQGPASGEVFQTGTTTIAFEATDEAGNVGACSFTVTVLEDVFPEITCPDDIVLNSDPGLCGATVSYAVPEGSDNCPGVTTALTAGLESGALFPVGTTTVTYTATDLSGNEVSCSFDVTVIDAEAPVFDCPDMLIFDSEAGLCEATISYVVPTAEDNCDGTLIPNLISGPPSGSTVPVGIATAVYEIADAAGNVATCEISIEVVDAEPPSITCPEDVEVMAGSGTCESIAIFDAATAADNCGVATITQIEGPASGSLFPVGPTTITYEAIDVNGLSTTCSFTVTVTEDVAPVITCPDVEAVPNEPGLCGANVEFDLPEATDNCGAVSISLTSGNGPGDFFEVGSTDVTYTATDISGNTATCTFVVVVTDDEAPTFDCAASPVVIMTDEGSCNAVYSFDLPAVSDNCDSSPVVIQTSGPESGTSLPLGETQFSFESTDEAGNTASCAYTVLVVDNEVPVFANCPENLSFEVADTGCEAIISFQNPTATDNCAVTVTQVEGPTAGSSLVPGVYLVVFEAVDPAGNASQCSFEISVNDTVAPEFACPDDLESCDRIVSFDPPLSFDNCGEVTVVQTEGPESGTLFPIGTTLISFVGTDESGNSSTCSFNVEVLQAAPRAEVGSDLNICGNLSTTLEGSDSVFAIGTWSLIGGAGTILSPNQSITVVEGLAEGVNSFEWAIDPLNGCEISRDTISITVEPGVSVEAGPDESILAGSEVALAASATPPGGTWFWEPQSGLSCTNCSSPVASPLESTLYFATYTTDLGCSITDSLFVRVFREFPNTITPNNDGVNDVWNIPSIGDFPNVEVRIYNRWGTEVFSSVGYSEPWDGTRNGAELPEGSYFYVIDYKQDAVENLNGTVNIIR